MRNELIGYELYVLIPMYYIANKQAPYVFYFVSLSIPKEVRLDSLKLISTFARILKKDV